MKKVLFLMLLFVVLGAASVSAQIRIGGDEAPNAAAVLDLNVDDDTNDGTKGLALPRVNFNTNTAQITSGVANLTGMLVYNTNTTLGAGVYFWDGSQWVVIGGDGIVVDAVTDATAGGGLVRNGSGTASAPYTLGIAAGGVTTSMILDGAITTAALAEGSVSLGKTTLSRVNFVIDGVGAAIGDQKNAPLPTGVNPANCWVQWAINNGGQCDFYGTTQMRALRLISSPKNPITCAAWCFN